MNQPQDFFRALEARIEAMPDGPSAHMRAPKWKRALNVIGLLGLAAGLLPSLLILLFEPHVWMVWLARGGLVAMAVGWIPTVIWDLSAVLRSFRRWGHEQADQLDHDFAEWHRLCEWLAGHPQDFLERHLRWLQVCQIRMTAKLGFLAGGIEKLGILPVLIALAVQARIAASAPDIPKWQLILGLFVGTTYLIALLGSLLRQRMQLYEMAVTEALTQSGPEAVGTDSRSNGKRVPGSAVMVAARQP